MASAPAGPAPAAAPASPAAAPTATPGKATPPAREPGNGAAPSPSAPTRLKPIATGKPPIPGMRHFTPKPDPVAPDTVAGERDDAAAVVAEGAPVQPKADIPAPLDPAPDAAANTTINIRGKAYTAAQLQKAIETLNGRVKANERDAEAYRQLRQREGQGNVPSQQDGRVPDTGARNLPRQQSQPAAPPEGQAPPADFVTAAGDQFWDALPAIAEKHGIQTALALVQQKSEQHMQTKLDGLTKTLRADILRELAPQLEALAPVVEQHTTTQNQTIATERFKNLAAATGEDGAPLIPELASDPELQQMAGLLWLQAGHRFGREYAMSDYAHWAAVRDAQVFRDNHNRKQQTAGNTASGVLDTLERAQQAGASLASSGPSAPPVAAPEGSPHEDQAQLKRRILSANTGSIKTKTGIDMGVKPFHGGRDED